MSKKKLITSLIIVVMLVAAIATMLVGCKPKDKKPVDPVDPHPEYKDAMFLDIVNKISEGLGNDMTLNKFGLGGQINVDTTVGDAKNAYKIELATTVDLNLSFATKPTFATDANGVVTMTDPGILAETDTYGSFIGLKISKGDKVLLGFYYEDSAPDADLTNYNPYNACQAWLEFRKADGTMQKNAITAPSVKGTLRAEYKAHNAGYIDGDQLKDDALNAGIESIIGYAGIATINNRIATDGSWASFEMPITKLLTQGELADTLAKFDVSAYLDPLGIDIDIKNLGAILPTINIEAKASFKDSKFNGIDLSLAVAKKDIVIKHKDAETKLLDLQISKDLSAKVALKDFKLGALGSNPIAPENYDNFAPISALNFKLGGNISIDKPITANIANVVTLNVPAGEFSVKVEADIDPTALLGKNFTNGVDANGKPKADLAAIIGAISGAIKYADIQIVSTGADKKVLLGLNVYSDGQAKVNIGILAGDPIILGPIDLESLLNKLIGLLSPKKSADTPSLAAAGDGGGLPAPTPEILATLKTIGGILKNLQIACNSTSNGLSVDLQNTVINIDPKIDIVLGVKALLNKDGLALTVKVKNQDHVPGSNVLQEKDKLDHTFKINITSFSYGTCVPVKSV